MARTVDPARHAARRQQILVAALTCFATTEWQDTSTTAISRAAGIGSGTLFHYFPTKTALLAGVVAQGTAETVLLLADRDGAGTLASSWSSSTSASGMPETPSSGVSVLAAVGASHEPDVQAALQADAAAVREGLTRWLAAAGAAGQVRTDLDPARLARWVALVLDGFLDPVTTDPGLDAAHEAPVLRDTVLRLVSPVS